MSLPLLLSYRGNGSNNGPASKLRGGKPNGQKRRSSLDTGSASAGRKRSVSALEPPEEALLRDAFGLSLEDSGSQSPRLSKVGIVGLNDLGDQLAGCLASKPGVCYVGVHTDTNQLGKYDIMPGVHTHRTLRELCQWSNMVCICGSYEETQSILGSKELRVHLRGKCVVNLTRGTPDDAITTASVAKEAGVRYLDAYVITGGAKSVFGHRLSSIMVSGNQRHWREVEYVIKAVAPASFYGGPVVAWANSVTVGVSNFFTSLRMGIQDAEAYTAKFELPRHVLPQVIVNGFMGKIRSTVLAASKTAARPLSLPPLAPILTCPTVCTGAQCKVGSISNGGATSTSTRAGSDALVVSDKGSTPLPGSDEWRAQLLQIRDVCQRADVAHSIIDSLLMGSGEVSALATADDGVMSLREDGVQKENDGAVIQGGLATGNGEPECSDLGGVFDEDLFSDDFCAMNELLADAPITDDMVLSAAWVP